LRLTEKTGDPAPEQEDGILPLPVLLAFGAATTLVANVEANLGTRVAGAAVGFTVVATTALLLSIVSGMRLLVTQVSKFGLRAAFKSWFHLPNAR
jgi:hypothetical protein